MKRLGKPTHVLFNFNINWRPEKISGKARVSRFESHVWNIALTTRSYNYFGESYWVQTIVDLEKFSTRGFMHVARETIFTKTTPTTLFLQNTKLSNLRSPSRGYRREQTNNHVVVSIVISVTVSQFLNKHVVIKRKLTSAPARIITFDPPFCCFCAPHRRLVNRREENPRGIERENL